MERSSYERSTQIPNNQFSYFPKREGRNRSKNQSERYAEKKIILYVPVFIIGVCVVGKKELIYQLVEELKIMQTNIREVTDQLEQAEITLSEEGLQDMKNDCLDMLRRLSGCWMAQVTCAG